MALELRNVSKVVNGTTYIKDTSMRLEPGRFNVLLGQTGSGKTSLIKLMAGLDAVATGSVWIDDIDVTRVSTQKRQVSLVHQFFVNYPHMTVFENIASPLRVAGMARDDIRRRVEETADILKLRPMLKRRPHELSGGQQQRTALARAIAKDAKVVLLDEPLANLDYKLREELREQLPEWFADRGAVVVYATSEPEEALLLGGHTALMDDGQVRQFGPTADLYRTPDTLLAARVFSDPPINTAQVDKRGDSIHLGSVSWTIGARHRHLGDGGYQLAIRPHHVLPRAARSTTAEVDGVVSVTELNGSESSAHFQFDDNSWVSLAHGVHPYQVGERHRFYFDPADCLFFANDGARVS